MTWWRRDPSILSRSSIRHYERVLRDNDAALRSRCFSRTPSKLAQHEEDSKSKRPANMTNLEWMQLQHYERWRKRLREDPYKVLFGASNDMLNGKGLTNWEWVYKTFPKWMLREMDVDEQPQQGSRNATAKSRSSNKVDSMDEHSGTSKARETHFPQPSFRTTRFERGEFSGIMSPSDLRRPRESKYVNTVDEVSNGITAKESSTSRELPLRDESTIFIPPASKLSGSTDATIEQRVKEVDVNESITEGGEREPVVADSKFTRGSSASLDINVEPEAPNEAWQQTTLQRRLASKLILEGRAQSPSVFKSSEEVLPLERMVPANSSQGSSEFLDTHKKSHVAKDAQQDTSSESKGATFQDSVTSPRSASRILSQLPRDDIDFLTAAEIRASMGTKRSRIPTDEQREAKRQDLEVAFQNASPAPPDEDIIEKRFIDKLKVQFQERDVPYLQATGEIRQNPPTEQPVLQVSSTESTAESSIDRMKRWLETTGASFAKQFWQDPTEEADITKTRLFFDKAAHYLKKVQAATRQISEDLEKDIPASRELLKRLKSDEGILDLAIHRLRQRSSSGLAQGLTPRKIRAIDSFKTRFYQTNSELEKAHAALRELAGTDSTVKATESFKRRLTTASTVLHKNAQLLRMLIWSLQARLEDPKIDRNIVLNYKVVADNLLSLRDTQMTLVRLLDRAMLVYGVVPTSPDKTGVIGDSKNGHATFENCEEPFIRARLAADEHLINEIKSHKEVVQGLSDNGSTRTSESTSRSVLGEPSPLAHSLFRPFGPVLEKISSDEVSGVEAEKAKDDEKRKLHDTKLVDEIKKAYENTYGTITTDQPQAAPDTTVIDTGAKDEGKENISLERDLATAEPDGAGQHAQAIEEIETKSTETTEVTAAGASISSASEAEPPNTESGLSASSLQHSDLEAAEITDPIPSNVDIPTHYTIIVRDPQTDSLSITTSMTGPPRDNSAALPLHQALSSLDSPAKFIPFITEGLEVVSAGKDILVLRDALDSTASTRPFETINTPSSTTANEDLDVWRNMVNPIDGTARLSPTGYVGPEESREQLEKEFEERRQAAGKFNDKEALKEDTPRQGPKARRKGGAGSIAKTAIWVAGMCYVAGVIGEISGVPH